MLPQNGGSKKRKRQDPENRGSNPGEESRTSGEGTSSQQRDLTKNCDAIIIQTMERWEMCVCVAGMDCIIGTNSSLSVTGSQEIMPTVNSVNIAVKSY